MFDVWKQVGKTQKTEDGVRKLLANHFDVNALWIKLFVGSGSEDNDEYTLNVIVKNAIIDRYEIRVKSGKYTLFERQY